MPQLTEYSLTDLGIESPLNLYGSLAIFPERIGLPVIFLFDEHHGNHNKCIDSNIKNARELIEKANVTIIGVEGLAGGDFWDKQNQKYDDDYDEKKLDKKSIEEYKSEYNIFVDLLSKTNNNLITGVECWGMKERITEDLLQKGNIYFGKDISTHHLCIERSKHFIKTLLKKHRTDKNNIGNLILNCGQAHNTHIEEWVRSGQILDIVGEEANYVRINTIGLIINGTNTR